MKERLIADRYARALGEAIPEAAQKEQAAQAMRQLTDLYEQNAEFRHTVTNPTLPTEGRSQILDTALTSVNAPDVLQRLIKLLLERNRLSLLPAVCAQFQTRVDEWLNRVEVTAVTVMVLPDDMRAQLIRSLEKFTGRTVRLNNVIDPNIIGGIVIYIWGVHFDFSLRTRFERLKQTLLAEGTHGY